MNTKEVNEKKAQREYEKRCKKAEQLLNEPDKLERILQKLEKKMKKIPVVGDSFSLVPAMISLVRSYMKKEYTQIPMGSIIGIISALIYILSPVDLIPDAIPAAGFVDDASILLLCLKAGAKDDIEEYQKWREDNNKNI